MNNESTDFIKKRDEAIETIREFIKERNEALLSLDREKIIAFCLKCNLTIPENETIFWAGIHKTIVNLESASSEQKEHSAKWLIQHGFKLEIF